MAVLPNAPLPNDFNGDGSLDLLWQNISGKAAIRELNGTNVLSGSGSLGNRGSNRHIKATGDFNNDGQSDILWQNNSGETAVWEMNGTSLIAGAGLANPGPAWHV